MALMSREHRVFSAWSYRQPQPSSWSI